MLVSVLWILAGLVLLVAGGEALVRGASALARFASVGPLVIGLTVVAFGTSAPELATGVGAALSGKADLVVGNVVGSNIANILLILGIASLIKPLTVQSRLVRLDVPLMVLASVALLVMAWGGNVSRFEGGCLLISIVVYTVWLILQSRAESAIVEAEFDQSIPLPKRGPGAVLRQCLLVAVALVLLVLGARWLVSGATDLARVWGVSELAIGLTIVAVGTSLPELMTSVMAAIRGECDIAVGNVVGSNLFNILSVFGASALLSPGGIDVAASAIQVDIPVMTGVAIICLPIFVTGYRISRLEGALFLVGYVGYTVYLLQ